MDFGLDWTPEDEAESRRRRHVDLLTLSNGGLENWDERDDLQDELEDLQAQFD